MRRKRFEVIWRCPHTDRLKREHVLLYPNPATGGPGPNGLELLEKHADKHGVEIASVLPVARGGRYSFEQCAPWKVIEANLQEASEFFELNYPIYVKQTAHKGLRNGAYRLRLFSSAGNKVRAALPSDTKLYHHITVKDYIGFEHAGQTLWHELAHAMQAEREVSEHMAQNPFCSINQARTAWVDEHHESKKIKYSIRPTEVEARTFEYRNEYCPLAEEA